GASRRSSSALGSLPDGGQVSLGRSYTGTAGSGQLSPFVNAFEKRPHTPATHTDLLRATALPCRPGCVLVDCRFPETKIAVARRNGWSLLCNWRRSGKRSVISGRNRNDLRSAGIAVSVS